MGRPSMGGGSSPSGMDWNETFNTFMGLTYTNDVNVNSNKIFVIEGRNSTKINDNHRITYGAEYIKNTVKGTNFGNKNPANITHLGSVTMHGVKKRFLKKKSILMRRICRMRSIMESGFLFLLFATITMRIMVVILRLNWVSLIKRQRISA